MEREFQILPPNAGAEAGSVDMLYFALVLTATFFTALICVLILLFIARYRSGRLVDREARMTQRQKLLMEFGWSFVPFLIVMTSFAWGAQIYFQQRSTPQDALEVYVVGKQWMWKVQHPEGRREINTLHVPTGRPVILKMISEDVIHSFFIPAFRSKMDVLPGRYTSQWFTPTRPGVYHLFCAEYCGTSHSQMIGSVIVQTPQEYAEWLAADEDEPAESRGRRLLQQYGCLECHHPEPGRRGPPLAGLFGRQVLLANGETVVADENYVRESIRNPDAKIAAGYQAIMPPFPQISEEEILLLLAYFKSRAEVDEERNP